MPSRTKKSPPGTALGLREVARDPTLRSGAVVIIDALGTRGLWSSSDPRDAVKSLGGLGRAFEREFKRGPKRRGRSYSRLSQLNGLPSQDVVWKCQTISDTVIATASTTGALGSLLLFVAVELAPLIGVGFEIEHPFRGAVSVGRFYESGSALIGPAVDEAAEWHDKTDWAGLVLTPSAAQAFESVGAELKLPRGPAYVKTLIPLKDGPIEGWALNWPLDNVSRHAIVRAFSKPPISPDVARKLARTLAFFDANHRP